MIIRIGGKYENINSLNDLKYYIDEDLVDGILEIHNNEINLMSEKVEEYEEMYKDEERYSDEKAQCIVKCQNALRTIKKTLMNKDKRMNRYSLIDDIEQAISELTNY